MSGRRKVCRWLWRRMYDAGWTQSRLDDSLRSRIAHAIYDWKHWYDWGHPVMWLVGRNDSGSSGVPRGRDMWWIPTEYVEGIASPLVADFDKRFGCYVTTKYADIRTTGSDIDWRYYDLQDAGRTVKVGLWPNEPEHKGHVQPLPWNELKVNLFLWWYVWQHKGKAQWFGLRPWLYYKALHAAVHDRKPFACQVVPENGSGGYSHWHCQRRKFHKGAHRYRNYIWPGPGERVQYDPQDVAS